HHPLARCAAARARRRYARSDAEAAHAGIRIEGEACRGERGAGIAVDAGASGDNRSRRRFRREMSLRCGIVGLPNVGKSTLFNALTKASIAAENYPFCTIEP